MWKLIGIELFKIFKRPRTYISFVAIAAIVLLIQLALYVDGKKYLDFVLQSFEQSFAIGGVVLNGYFVCFVILQSLFVHVPLLISLVAGDMVAGEANMGTLRLLLTKPVSRASMLMSKFLAASVYTVVLLTFLAILALAGSVIIFGTGDLMVLKSDSVNIISSGDVLWRYLSAFTFAALSMVVVASLAFLLSVFAENSVGPIISAMAIIIVFTILTSMDIPFFVSLKPYLFTNHMLNWKGFFDTPVDVAEVLKSAIVLLLHIVFFVTLSVLVFRKKDILS